MRVSWLTSTLITYLTLTCPAQAKPEVVAFDGYDYAAGTIVVKTSERRLYYVTDGGQALRYPVGVGKEGMRWSGRARIERKLRYPAWARDRMSRIIPGGSPENPMGVAAMSIRGGKYAIHGTNKPGSIGGFVSHGCIRMYNHDVLDLYSRVRVGAPVVVLP